MLVPGGPFFYTYAFIKIIKDSVLFILVGSLSFFSDKTQKTLIIVQHTYLFFMIFSETYFFTVFLFFPEKCSVHTVILR
jgi:hypothetical protein